MAKRTYNEKLSNLNLWVEIVNHHWQQLRGEIYNDKDFWQDTLHAMTDSDWWDWVDLAPALRAQHEDLWQRYPMLAVGTKEVEDLLRRSKPIVKRSAQGRNFTAFRLLMNIKDFLNDVNGTPTRLFHSEPKPVDQGSATPFERLFEV